MIRSKELVYSQSGRREDSKQVRLRGGGDSQPSMAFPLCKNPGATYFSLGRTNQPDFKYQKTLIYWACKYASPGKFSARSNWKVSCCHNPFTFLTVVPFEALDSWMETDPGLGKPKALWTHYITVQYDPGRTIVVQHFIVWVLAVKNLISEAFFQIRNANYMCWGCEK